MTINIKVSDNVGKIGSEIVKLSKQLTSDIYCTLIYFKDATLVIHDLMPRILFVPFEKRLLYYYLTTLDSIQKLNQKNNTLLNLD